MLLKYLLAGTFNTAVAFVTYWCLVRFFLTPPWLANIAGISLSFLSGFLLSKWIVFTSSRKTSSILIAKYAAVLLIQYVIGTAIIYIMIRFGLSKVEAYLVALPTMVAISFGLQRYWVFKE